jgi:hypothetical protein
MYNFPDAFQLVRYFSNDSPIHYFPTQTNQSSLFRTMWNFATVAATVEAFDRKWDHKPVLGNDSDSDSDSDDEGNYSKVECLMDDLFRLVEQDDRDREVQDASEDASMDGEAEVLARGEALRAAAGARVLKAINDGDVPVEDILLALYRGYANDGNTIKFKSLPLLIRLAYRFLEAYPDVHIPLAFCSSPPPYRPVAGDDFLLAEEACYRAALHCVMALHADVPSVLPWAEGVIPQADYRAPDNYIEEDEDEDLEAHPEDYSWIMNVNDCSVLMQMYTSLVLA